MFWATQAVRSLMAAALFASIGCCYHAQHFGKARDIGIGEIGCSTCAHGSTPCERQDCSQGNCCPNTLPLKTSDLAIGNSVVTMSLRDRSKMMVGQLHEKIDGPKTERIQLVMPSDTFTTGRVVTHTTELPANIVSPSVQNQAKPLPSVITVEAEAPPMAAPSVVAIPEPGNVTARKAQE